MKTLNQKNVNVLAFNKSALVELNTSQMRDIDSGVPTITIVVGTIVSSALCAVGAVAGAAAVGIVYYTMQD